MHRVQGHGRRNGDESARQDADAAPAKTPTERVGEPCRNCPEYEVDDLDNYERRSGDDEDASEESRPPYREEGGRMTENLVPVTGGDRFGAEVIEKGIARGSPMSEQDPGQPGEQAEYCEQCDIC